MSPIVDFLLKSGPTVWFTTGEMAEKFNLSKSHAASAMLLGMRNGQLKRQPAGCSYLYAAAERPPTPPPVFTHKILDPFGRSKMPVSAKRAANQQVPAWQEIQEAWR